MEKHRKFVICKICGNIAGMIHDAGVPMMCCGEVMEELEVNTGDGAKEKHVPVIERKGDEVIVKVGSTGHPMTEEHLIDWVYLQTQKGGQRKKLDPSDVPEARFIVTKDDAPVAAFAYCNLHGFWKSMDL